MLLPTVAPGLSYWHNVDSYCQLVNLVLNDSADRGRVLLAALAVPCSQ